VNDPSEDRAGAPEPTAFDAEDSFRLLVESVKDYAIFMLDRSGIIRTWNRGAERVKGYSANEIVGRHFSVFYTEADRLAGKPQRGLKTALAEGRFEDEGWRVRSDGILFWADAVITAVYDAHGTHRGFAKITRDLTERRQREKEQIRLAHAEEGVRLRDEFMSIAAHELRTPLNALQLQIEAVGLLLARENTSTVDKSDFAPRIQRSKELAARLGALITRLLDVSRISSGRLVLDTQPMDLVACAREVIATFQLRARGREINLRAPTEATGIWDRLRIEQVVYNLVDNALNHGEPPIDLSIAADDRMVTLDVMDRGPGIAPEDCHRIFRERFVYDKQKRSGRGLGLGLYISHKIVKAHGGQIELKDSPNGAHLRVRLPREAPDDVTASEDA
jgi:PAS domain S-box-containing protein